MLNEGLHVDGVNGVIMLRRTASPRIFYQQIGRCIAAGGYDAPIIFDFVNNFNSIMATDFLKDLTDAVEREQKRRDKAEKRKKKYEEQDRKFRAKMKNEDQFQVEIGKILKNLLVLNDPRVILHKGKGL